MELEKNYQKLDYNGIEAFLDLLQEKDIDWYYIQGRAKKSLNIGLINKYAVKWNWKQISSDSNLVVDVDFIDLHL